MTLGPITRTVLSLGAGAVLGVALVISCDMGPHSQAQSSTGGSTGGTTTGGTGGTAGGTGGNTTGGCGGCSCTFSGTCSVSGTIKSNPPSDDVAQLVVVSAPLVLRTATVPSNLLKCTAAVNGFPELLTTAKGAEFYCVKIAAGPFVLSDLVQNGKFQSAVFVAPGDASLTQAGFQPRWSYLPTTTDPASGSSEFHGLRLAATAGESLYAFVGDFNLSFANQYVQPARFTWSGFQPYP